MFQTQRHKNLGRNFPEDGDFRGEFSKGGNFPGGNFNYPRGKIFLAENFPGAGSFQGESVRGGEFFCQPSQHT